MTVEVVPKADHDAAQARVKELELYLTQERANRDSLAACVDRDVKKIKELQAQLPAEMPGCTILFKECEKGHGRLTATNWTDHGCGTCALESLQAQLAAWQTGKMHICLLCGRDKPCMTDEEAIAEGGPGKPCTFDPTPRELFDENKRLKAQLRQVEGERDGLEQNCLDNHAATEQAE